MSAIRLLSNPACSTGPSTWAGDKASVVAVLLSITAYDGSAAGSLWVADSSPRWVAAVVLNVSVSGVRSPASLGADFLRRL